METATPNHLPTYLGIGAIGLAALAAGLAAGPYLRDEPSGPPLPPPGVEAGPEAGAGAPNGGMTLPEGAEEGARNGGELPPDAVPLSEDERLGDLLTEIIDGYGELKRRIDALEAGAGGAAEAGGGTTRLDPKTGQEYRAVTVWVPEGMQEEAVALLRDAVLDRLAARAEQAAQTKLHTLLWTALRDQKLPEEPLLLSGVEPWRPLMREFAAAWTDRDPDVLREFTGLLAKHLAPYLQRAKAAQAGNEATWPGPDTPPAPDTELRDVYDRLQNGLRTEWKTFVEGLPFDVRERYLSWCSPFLSGN